MILWDVRDPARPQRIGQPLTGHTGIVCSVAFAPDGHTLATGSYDGTVILWDVRDPARPQRIGQQLTGHTGAVNSVAFSVDGHTLAAQWPCVKPTGTASTCGNAKRSLA